MIAFLGKPSHAKLMGIVKTIKSNHSMPVYQYLLLMSEWSKVVLVDAVNAKVSNKMVPTLSTSAKF